MEREETLNLIPAYALNALDKDDRLVVESLLATDAEAQQLLMDYLAFQDVIIFSASLKETPAHLTDDLRQRLKGKNTKTRRFPPVRYAMLAAALLVVIFGGVLLVNRPQSPEALYKVLAQNTNTRQLAITPTLNESVEGDMLIAANDNQAIIRVNNLPPLNEDQAFQLWLVDADGAQSGGIFQFEQQQLTNYIVIPVEKPVSAYQGFGISLEPSTGSPFADGPSGPQVFRVALN